MQRSWELVVRCSCFAGFQREKYGLHETRYRCFAPKQRQRLRAGADWDGPRGRVPLGRAARGRSRHGCLCRSWTPESSEDCRYGMKNQKRFQTPANWLVLVDRTGLWQNLIVQLWSWFGPTCENGLTFTHQRGCHCFTGENSDVLLQ